MELNSVKNMDEKGQGEEETPGEHAESLEVLQVGWVLEFSFVQRSNKAECCTAHEDFQCSDQEEWTRKVFRLQHDYRHCSRSTVQMLSASFLVDPADLKLNLVGDA